MKRTDLISQLRPVLMEHRASLLRSFNGEWNSLIEGADEPCDDETLAQLSSTASHEMEAVDQALQRMRDGVYGVCESCGRNIANTRLKALPFATTCIQCQRRCESPPPRLQEQHAMG